MRLFLAGPCDDCGFTSGPKRTERLALRGLDQHSCAKQIARAAAAERGRARMAAIDRAPKACLHKETDHQHGTYACYTLDKCRCIPCAEAASAYEQDRTRQQAYGRWNGYVDAEPARKHVRALMDAGMGLKRIVAVGGASQGTLWKLMYGKRRRDGSQIPSRRIKPEVAERLLAVTVDLAEGAVVAPIGTTRRVQALVAVGWSMAKIAERIGVSRGNFTPIAHGRRNITRRHQKAIVALYEELWDQEPPRDNHRDRIACARALNYAASHGWAPPLAWDDDSIDDPTATPHVGDSTTSSRGRPLEHLVDDVEWYLHDVDAIATTAQVANRLGLSASAIQHALDRAERTDLLDRLVRNAELSGTPLGRRRSA